MPITQLLLDAEPVTGEVGDDGATQFWSFNGEAGRVVRITASSGAVTTVVALLSSNGTLLARDDEKSCPRMDSQLDVPLPADGDYQIRVSTGGTGCYQVAVRSLDRIEAAATAEETLARMREADYWNLLTMLVGYCIPPEEQTVLTNLAMDVPLDDTQRGYMVVTKLQLLEAALCEVERDYRVAAKYFLCYRAEKERRERDSGWKWIVGRRLKELGGARTQEALRAVNGPAVRQELERMVRTIAQLTPPLTVFTARLAVPGRTCVEIATVLEVIDAGDVGASLEKTGELAQCWAFWQKEREEGNEGCD